MKNLQSFLWIIVLVLTTAAITNAQTRTITGKVSKDGTNEAIEGTSVGVEGADAEVVTDANGEFTLKIPNNLKKVRFKDFGQMKIKEVIMLGNDRYELVLVDLISENLFELSLEELMNMEVVSASKKAQKISDAPASMFVITQEQIKQNGYMYLHEVLAEIAGVEVLMRTIPEVMGSLAMRGISENSKFVMLIDGIRISSPAGSRYTIDFNFPITYAERIEVILGPASALYGADAFSGIVNIITKTPQDRSFIDVTTSYGQYNTTQNSIVGGIKKNDVSILLSGGLYHSDEPFLPDFYPEEFDWYTNHYSKTGEMLMFGNSITVPMEEYNRDLNAYSFNGKLNYQGFTAGFAHNFESHSSSVAGDPSEYLSIADARWETSHTHFYTSYDFLAMKDKLHSSTTISYTGFETLPSSIYINVYSAYNKAYKYANDNVTKIEQQLSYSINEKTSLIGGGSYEYFSAFPKSGDLPTKFDKNAPVAQQDMYWPGSNIVDKDGNSLKLAQDFMFINYFNFGSYLQFQTNIKEKLSLTISSRYDYNSRYGSTINPRLGLVIKPMSKLSVKFLYGKAFLAPSVYQAYQQYGSFYPTTNNAGEITGLQSSFLHLATNDLKPETNNTFESTITFLPSEMFYVSVNGFYNQMTDLIQSGGYSGGTYHDIPVGWIEKAVNKGSAESYGVLVSMVGKINLGKNMFNANISYSYIDGNIDDNPLTYTSKNMIKAALSANFQKFDVRLSGMYSSGNHLWSSTFDTPHISKPYTLLNVYAAYNFNPMLKLFVNASNVLNTKYYNSGQFLVNTPQDPIRIIAGINLSIK